MSDQLDKIRRWIDEKTPNLRCPCCTASFKSSPPQVYGTTYFTSAFVTGGPSASLGVNDLMLIPLLKQEGELVRGYVVVPITCNNCGYIMIFEAKKLGLVEDPPKVNF